MHPEYPCAHCIISTAVAATIEAILGTAEIPEAVMTSPTAPDVTHRWTNIRAYADEVAHARIWAGFHYRFSVKAGQDMGPDDRSIRRAERDAAGEHRGRALIDASAGSVVSNPAAVFNTVRARCQLDQNGLKADVRVESDLAPIADVGRAPRHVAEVP
jgi:hypothetical protein